MGLRKELRTKNRHINRNQLDQALKTLNIEESDCEIIDKLFTLFDKTGAGKVEYLSLIVGLSCLVNIPIYDRIGLSLELTDLDGNSFLTRSELKLMFKSLALVCSFVGDPVMTDEDAEEMIESLFVTLDGNGGAGGSDTFGYADNSQTIVEHPIFDRWLRARDEEEEGTKG